MTDAQPFPGASGRARALTPYTWKPASPPPAGSQPKAAAGATPNPA